MNTPVPDLPLLNTAQTAAVIRQLFLDGPVAMPESWMAHDEKIRIGVLGRSALKFAYGEWYAWYLGNPIIPALDIERAEATILPIYDRLPSQRAMVQSMRSRGHGAAMDEIFALRRRILGSGLTFQRMWDRKMKGDAGDQKLCILFALAHLPRGNDKKPIRATFLQAAYEGADMYITNLSRTLRDIETQARRNATREEYNIIARKLSHFILRAGYRQRRDTMRDILFHEHGSNTFTLSWKDGALKDVTYKRCDDPGLMEHPDIRPVYATASKMPVHTGCPAVHAQDNPLKGILQWYADAAAKGLFPEHFKDQALRPAQNNTL